MKKEITRIRTTTSSKTSDPIGSYANRPGQAIFRRSTFEREVYSSTPERMLRSDHVSHLHNSSEGISG